MIILYEYTETAFTNNGLGCLNDATSCVVSETLNGEYELEMEYPVNGIHYSDIQLRRIIFAKPNSYDREQPFRIYSISKPIGGLVTVNAEHISYDMSGLPVRGAIEHYAWYVKDVFDHIKNNSVYPCPFTFSSDITEEKKSISLSKPRSVKAFLGTDEGLLSLFGGEWEFDRYNAILHKERGQNRGVSIEYGKNLTDVTQDEACSEMYTAVYPYYYQEDDGLQRLDEDVVKILDTTYNNVCVLDLTSEFDEMPTQDQLRAKTQEYIKDNKLGEPKVSLKVSFIKNPEVIEALQDVRLGDTVGVKFIKIGVNTTSRCINYEFNVLTEQYNSIGLGEPTKTIVDTMTSTSSRIDAANSAIDDTQNDLDDEIDRATDAEGALSTRIDKTDSDITLEVARAKYVEGQLDASLVMKLGRDENDQVVSMINASADQISLRGNRLIIDSNNFQLDGDGHVYIVESLGFKASAYGENMDIIGLDGRANPVLQNIYLDLNSVTAQNDESIATTSYVDNLIASIPEPPVKKITASPTGTHSGTIKKAIRFLNVIGGSGGTYQIHGEVYTIDTGSDRRIKDHITDLPEELESAYLNLHPVKFRYKPGLKSSDSSQYHYGFISQELEKALSDVGIRECDTSLYEYLPVDTDEHVDLYVDDKLHHVNYRELHAMHVQMIQKQQHEIESLKLEHIQIKGELDILKQRLKRLEEKLC